MRHLLALLVLLLATTSVAFAQEGAAATGTVVDSDGNPIAGAEVAIVAGSSDREARVYRSTGMTTRTGADGTFRLTLRGGCEYAILGARAPGFRPVTTDVLHLAPRSNRTGIRVVLPPGETLVVRVVDDITEKPIPRAKVRIYPRHNHNGPHWSQRFAWFFRTGGMGLDGVADAEGICRVPDFPAGMIGANAKAPGYSVDGGWARSRSNRLIQFPDTRELVVRILPVPGRDATGRELPPGAVTRIPGENWPRSIEATPARKRIVLTNGWAKLHGRPGTLPVNIQKPRGVRLLCAALSPDGGQAVVGGDDGVLRTLDLDSGKLGEDRDLGAGPIADIAYVLDGTTIAVALYREVRLLGETNRTLGGFPGLVSSLAATSAGRRLAAACRERVSVWDAVSGERLADHEAGGRATRLRYSPDGKRIALALTDGRVQLLGRSGSVWIREADPERALEVAFSPDGERVLVQGVSCGVRIFGRDGTEVVPAHGHTAIILDVDCSPDGSRVATAGQDGLVVVRDRKDGAVRHRLVGHRSPVRWVRFSPDGTALVSLESKGLVRLWNAGSGACRATLEARSSRRPPTTFSPDGSRFALVHGDEIRLHRVRDGAMIWSHRSKTERLDGVALSPVAPLLAVGADGGRIRLVEIPSGRVLRTLGPVAGVGWLGFTGDGRYVLDGGRRDWVRAWSVDGNGSREILTGRRSWGASRLRLAALDLDRAGLRLRLTGDTVSAVSLAADGHTMVGVESGRDLVIWDLSRIGD